MTTRLLCAIAALAFVATPPLAAQEPARLSGTWVAAGTGYGSGRLSCDICANDRDGGLAGYVAAGLTASRGLRVGLQLDGWFASEEPEGAPRSTQRMLNVGATAYWRPDPAGPWELNGGLSWGSYRAAGDDPDDEPLTAGMAGVHLGMGYALAASTRVTLTPFASALVTTSGDLTSGNTVVTDVRFTRLLLGLSAAWR